MIKKYITFALIVFTIFTITACSKDEILDNYNNAIQNVGEYELTGDLKLKGTRTYGVDSYVGSYRVDYKDFSGMEYIFGRTSIDRSYGNKIEIKCTSAIEGGSAKLIFDSGSNEPEVLCEFNKNNEYSDTIDLPGGRNYICIECNDFSGTVDLIIK